MGLKAFSSFNESREAYLSRLLLSYQMILQVGRKQSSMLTGREIRVPITMSFSTKENVWYRKDKESNSEKAKFLLEKA